MTNELDKKHNEFLLKAEKLYKFNQRYCNINVRLTGNNKYYYNHQIREFYDNLNISGFANIGNKQIKEKGLSFNNYSINLGPNQYHQDLQRFNDKKEMLGFVVGYNKAIAQMTDIAAKALGVKV
jgi:hypothetical protein|tara:strand:- start:775 stop:1146 length:372 start_codon:yes stop_codon:yes gene_type:complete